MALLSGEFAQERCQTHAVVNEFVKVCHVDACLLHRVAFPQSDGAILKGLVVDGNAEGGSDCVLTAVAFADGVFFVVAGCEVEFQVIHNLAGFFTNGITAHFTGARAAGR